MGGSGYACFVGLYGLCLSCDACYECCSGASCTWLVLVVWMEFGMHGASDTAEKSYASGLWMLICVFYVIYDVGCVYGAYESGCRRLLCDKALLGTTGCCCWRCYSIIYLITAVCISA